MLINKHAVMRTALSAIYHSGSHKLLAPVTRGLGAVLMLHQFGSSRESYKNLARQFQADGIAVLAIDGRGFGDSTKKADGSKVSASQSNEAVAGMKSDVAAAVNDWSSTGALVMRDSPK